MIRNTTRTGRLRRVAVAAASLGVCWMGACPLGGTQFRETALPAIQTGVTSILNGMLDGIFAVIQPEAGSTTDQ